MAATHLRSPSPDARPRSRTDLKGAKPIGGIAIDHAGVGCKNPASLAGAHDLVVEVVRVPVRKSGHTSGGPTRVRCDRSVVENSRQISARLGAEQDRGTFRTGRAVGAPGRAPRVAIVPGSPAAAADGHGSDGQP